MSGNLALLLALLLLTPPTFSSSHVSRSDFPPDFVFGAGTSAFQWEGAVNEDGRGISVWETFTHAGRAFDGKSADVTADGYHHYKEDVKLMSDIGLESFRFSISWPRIIPNGRGAINPKGIKFYNNLINELLAHGIQPHVTLFHFDLPQVLEDEYGGWLNPKIIDDFAAFADICFEEFGDRISYWTTINQPNAFSLSAYNQGTVPPGRCSPPFSFKCTDGDSTTEPYIAVHNFLLAHARVFELYRKKYKASQNGKVGMNVFAFIFYPSTDSAADVAACQRAFDFLVGWALNPIVFGDYPEVMKMAAKWKLPSFSKEQSELLRGSFDFLGINYYAPLYVSNKYDESGIRDIFGDANIIVSGFKNSSDEKLDPTNVPYNPDGLEDSILFLKRNYGDMPIYIHENGFGSPYNVTVNDTERVDYIKSSVNQVLSAIRNGSDCRGYFAWTFLDGFETLFGYAKRFGLYYVDFEDENRGRRPKCSAHWYRDFLKPQNLSAF